MLILWIISLVSLGIFAFDAAMTHRMYTSALKTRSEAANAQWDRKVQNWKGR